MNWTISTKRDWTAITCGSPNLYLWTWIVGYEAGHLHLNNFDERRMILPRNWAVS